jgi:hypothetical protein
MYIAPENYILKQLLEEIEAIEIVPAVTNAVGMKMSVIKIIKDKM